MPTLGPTGLGSGIDKDRTDYTIVTGEWEVGRIYETRCGPDISVMNSRRLMLAPRLRRRHRRLK